MINDRILQLVRLADPLSGVSNRTLAAEPNALLERIVNKFRPSCRGVVAAAFS